MLTKMAPKTPQHGTQDPQDGSQDPLGPNMEGQMTPNISNMPPQFAPKPQKPLPNDTKTLICHCVFACFAVGFVLSILNPMTTNT